MGEGQRGPWEEGATGPRGLWEAAGVRGHIRPFLLQPDPSQLGWAEEEGNGPGLGVLPSCPKWSEGPEPTCLASK